ncbi:MAG: flavohemoglobin expression-modulating QEGLA motif protein [Ilumatobacteraceae bacterium]
MTAVDVLSPDDLAIDHELADAASTFRFLLDVTPVNLVDARRRFFADGGTPDFVYSPLEDDPDVVEARLAAISVEDVTDVALAHLLTAKRRELELQLEMLRSRGTDRFLALSLQLYGTVSPALLGDAEALLESVTVPAAERGERLDADAFAARAEAELDHYRATNADLNVHVEVRADSSGVMVSNGNLLIAPTVSVPESRVHALLQHEVGTHIVTHINGSHQPMRLLGAGLADNDETQEGLAVFAEYLAGGLSPRRLRQLAARVIAVHQMAEGAAFATVHRRLVDSGVAAVEAFTITMRVFRSGGLTKDAVYLRGLRGIVTHVGAGGTLDALWLGKMALGDVPHIEDLRDRGALHEPLLLPRYLADPGAQARLAGITTTTTPVDLIGAAA